MSQGTRKSRFSLPGLILVLVAVFCVFSLPALPAAPGDAPSGTPPSGSETPPGSSSSDSEPGSGDPGEAGSPVETELGELDEIEESVLDEPPLELLLFDEEDLVEAASRKTTKVSEAPGTITLISREEMDGLGILTLEDLLRYVTSSRVLPGIVESSLELRGVQNPFNNKVLLLRNGRVLNNVYRGDFYMGLAQPLGDVERVEIVRGPGSALYGANAFAGFINLVTVSGDDIKGVRSTTSFGNDGLWYQNVLTGGSRGGIDWTVMGRAAGSDNPDIVSEGDASNNDAHFQGRAAGKTWFVDVGFSHVDADSPGTFLLPTPDDTAHMDKFSVDGRKVWNIGEKYKVSLRTFYTDADNVYEFVSLDLAGCDNGDPFCDLDEFGGLFDIVDPSGAQVPEETRRQYLISKNGPDSPLRKKAEEGDPDVYIDRDSYDAWKSGDLGRRTERQASRERRAFSEVQFDMQVLKTNYLLAGGGIQADILSNSDVGDHTFRNAWAFVEDEQRFLGDRLIGLASLRVDDHSYFGQTMSPRVSLIWTPRIGGQARALTGLRPPFHLKAGYGKAFRSPNFVELFGVTRVGPRVELFGEEQAGVALLRGNPDLEQESIETMEIQANWEPAPTVGTALTLFQYEIQNEVILNIDRDVVLVRQPVTRVPLPFPQNWDLMFDEGLAEVPTSAQFINVPEGTRGRGLELECSWTPRNRAEGLTIWGNYSHMYVDRPVEESLEFEIPPDSDFVRNSWTVVRREEGRLEGLNAGLVYRDPGDRWLLNYRARVTSPIGGSLLSDGRVAHDVSLGIRHKKFTARLTGINVTGTDYIYDPTDGSYPDLDPEWLILLGYHWDF